MAALLRASFNCAGVYAGRSADLDSFGLGSALQNGAVVGQLSDDGAARQSIADASHQALAACVERGDGGLSHDYALEQ
jgi:hypothetical protein